MVNVATAGDGGVLVIKFHESTSTSEKKKATRLGTSDEAIQVSSHSFSTAVFQAPLEGHQVGDGQHRLLQIHARVAAKDHQLLGGFQLPELHRGLLEGGKKKVETAPVFFLLTSITYIVFAEIPRKRNGQGMTKGIPT